MIKADIWRRCELSGKETVRLKQIENLLPFLADFTNAIVNVYVPGKTAGTIVLLVSERPRTIFSGAVPWGEPCST